MASVYKRTLPSGATRWVCAWNEPNGRQRRKQFRTKVEANRHGIEVESAKQRGDWIDDTLGRQTLVAFWEHHETVRSGRPSTLQRQDSLWRSHLEPRFGTTRVADIDKPMIERWLAQMDRSESTRRQARILLKQLLDHAVDARAIPRNPSEKTSIGATAAGDHGAMPFLTGAEVAELASFAASDHWWQAHGTADPTWATLVRFAAFTGMRQGELFALRGESVDLEGRLVEVVESATTVAGEVVVGPTKSGKRRSIGLPVPLLDELAEQIERTPGDLVWPSATGTHMRGTNFRRTVWKPTLDRLIAARVEQGKPAGVFDGFRFHDLRHTMVSLRIEAGESAKSIQDIAGHASIDTTFRIYGHLFPESKLENADRLAQLMFG